MRKLKPFTKTLCKKKSLFCKILKYFTRYVACLYTKVLCEINFFTYLK